MALFKFLQSLILSIKKLQQSKINKTKILDEYSLNTKPIKAKYKEEYAAFTPDSIKSNK